VSDLRYRPDLVGSKILSLPEAVRRWLGQTLPDPGWPDRDGVLSWRRALLCGAPSFVCRLCSAPHLATERDPLTRVWQLPASITTSRGPDSAWRLHCLLECRGAS